MCECHGTEGGWGHRNTLHIPIREDRSQGRGDRRMKTGNQGDGEDKNKEQEDGGGWDRRLEDEVNCRSRRWGLDPRSVRPLCCLLSPPGRNICYETWSGAWSSCRWANYTTDGFSNGVNTTVTGDGKSRKMRAGERWRAGEEKMYIKAEWE